jgi:hypothetical protein
VPCMPLHAPAQAQLAAKDAELTKVKAELLELTDASQRLPFIEKRLAEAERDQVGRHEPLAAAALLLQRSSTPKGLAGPQHRRNAVVAPDSAYIVGRHCTFCSGQCPQQHSPAR